MHRIQYFSSSLLKRSLILSWITVFKMPFLHFTYLKDKYKSNFQVETVGDKYMAVSGLPEPCAAHARCIAKLALDMMDMAAQVKVDGVPVVNMKHLNFVR